ncbi:hypothetical protein OBBRIDRAFT_507283 [Obba rivulosa]|uniref:DUF6535 domain-containing protein n=1 Tax=Obba rivulosa TaxID=1052685 RepID=A0A8E2AR87_9APHY|nr:hypothetical protein OBBRIDRAFT_507283 [Obba rivulosa]
MSSLSDPKPPPAPLVSDVSSAPDVSADHCKADPASYLGDAAYSHSMSLPSDDLEEPWDKFARKLCDRDRDTAKAWKEEIDTLLLLALLFSTILAVFNVGLYILNQSDSVANNNTQALLQIVSILSNTSVPLGLVTTPALASTRSPQSVLIHALTASSLIIGLSTAFIGTMIRQWLDFFISPHSDNGERSVYIHCLRWDIGLMAWHVPTLLMALSALLQLAMALFLGGLFVFLWTFNTVVGAVATIPLLCLYVFWLLTTLAPAFYPLCPYKSPQALFFVWFIRRVEIMVATLTHAASNNNTFGFSPTKRNSERRSPDDSLGHGHLYRIASHLRLILTSFIATQPGRAFSPRGPDVTWASLELDTMSEDGCLRKTSTCLKEHVFALGHTLLADEALLHKTPAGLIPISVRASAVQCISYGANPFGLH